MSKSAWPSQLQNLQIKAGLALDLAHQGVNDTRQTRTAWPGQASCRNCRSRACKPVGTSPA